MSRRHSLPQQYVHYELQFTPGRGLLCVSFEFSTITTS